MTKEQALDINFLKANHKDIYFFGLGFIQIKIDDVHRVHVYTDKLPMTQTEEEIHNHRYGFTSLILKGTLQQWTYEVTPFETGDYFITKETCNPRNKKEFPKTNCDVEVSQFQIFSAGSAYHVRSNVFHRVMSKDAITLLIREPYEKDEADVIYPKVLTPVCPFSIKVEKDELWKIVEESLK